MKRAKLTYLSERALVDLANGALNINRKNVPGVIIEAGTALGGSAIVLAAAKERSRRLSAYDMFGMIPPPTEKDGPDVHARYRRIVSGDSPGLRGDKYYGYRDDLIGDVRRAFEAFGFDLASNHVDLVQGLFQETLSGDEPVALAHLDGDWYESTKFCLNQIAPRMSPGGRFI